MKRSTIAAIAAVLASPVVAWWGAEEITRSSIPSEPDLMYAIHPLDLSAAAQRGIGILATVIFFSAFALLVRDRRKTGLAGFNLLILAGAIIGYAYSVFTWGSIGANIGVGFVILFGTPAFVVCIVLAVNRLRRASRQSSVAAPIAC